MKRRATAQRLPVCGTLPGIRLPASDKIQATGRLSSYHFMSRMADVSLRWISATEQAEGSLQLYR